MKKKVVLTFLIPALNEEEAIEKTIDTIKNIKKKVSYKIVIIDGESKDKTVELSKKNGAEVIHSKRGYGRQYQYGLNKIDSEYVITGDADCTYPYDQAYRILEALVLSGRYDFVTTNRFAGLKKKSMSFSHKIGNFVLTFFTNILFGVRIKDSQSGMWIFRLDSYKKLNMTDNDMAFSEEIKIEAFKKLKSVEIPISYYARVGTAKIRLSHGVKNLFFLFKKRVTW